MSGMDGIQRRILINQLALMRSELMVGGGQTQIELGLAIQITEDMLVADTVERKEERGAAHSL